MSNRTEREVLDEATRAAMDGLNIHRMYPMGEVLRKLKEYMRAERIWRIDYVDTGYTTDLRTITIGGWRKWLNKYPDVLGDWVIVNPYKGSKYYLKYVGDEAK